MNSEYTWESILIQEDLKNDQLMLFICSLHTAVDENEDCQYELSHCNIHRFTDSIFNITYGKSQDQDPVQ